MEQNSQSLIGTILEPNRPKNLPEHCQWLSGIGAGTWFCLNIMDEKKGAYRIRRYNSTGELDCDRFFLIDKSGFNIARGYNFTYISHCQQCVVLQGGKKFIFNYYEKVD